MWNFPVVTGITGHFLRLGQARKKPDAKNTGPAQLLGHNSQPRPSPWRLFSVEPSGQAFLQFSAQAQPVEAIRPIFHAQAWPDYMFWPDGLGHFWPGSGRAAYTQAWSRAKNGRQILLKRPALFGFDLKISVTWLYLLVVVAYQAFCSIMSHKFYTSLGTETAMQACPNCYLI
jgi:hypothetical protein